jgi:UDP-4-amino-4,6-dideoxy-N-acetyl-beta-L-altrosamine N-acetyltransferase
MLMTNDSGNLREIIVNDLDIILEWRNSERIRKYMFTDQVITKEQHLSWFENLKHDPKLKYLIFEYMGQPSGVVNFSNIDYRNHKCNWGIYLGKEDLPEGTGAIMGRLAIKYAFESLNIRKLCGEILAYNERSIKFHQKLGFIEEGNFQKHVLKNGNYTDIICFALFNENFIRSHGDE